MYSNNKELHFMTKQLIISISLSALFLLGCDKKEEPQPLIQVEEKVSLLIKERSLTNSKRHKVNLYFITQVGCGACKKIKEYMKNPTIKAFMEKDFIVTEVDITDKEELPFEWMKPFATPTLYFFDSKENEIIDPTVRRMSEKDFTDTLHSVLEIRDMD